MSNLKISQLPNFTGNTSGSWLIANNSGETETFKIQKESFLSGYATTGSNTFIGTETISGSVLIQGGPGAIALAINQGNFRISGSIAINSTTSTAIRQLFFTHPSGSLWGSTISYNPISGPSGSGSLRIENGISGSIVIGGTSENFIQGTNFIQGRTDISGSNTTITGSLGINGNTRINGNTTITGSLNVTSNAIISGSISVGQTDSANKTISFASSSINPGAVVQYYRDVVAGGRLEVNTGADNRGVVAVGGGQNGTKTGSFLSLDKNTGNTLLFGSSSISIESPLINVTGSVTTTGNVNVSGSIVLGGVSENIYFNSGSGIGAFVSYDPTLNGVGGTLSVNTNGTVGLVNLGASGVNGASLSLNKQIGKATLFGSSSISLQGNNIDVTGSVNISQVMTLAKQNPLPTGTTGSLAVSGSGLYFHNGTSWNLIS
jgi:hypothetical protein